MSEWPFMVIQMERKCKAHEARKAVKSIRLCCYSQSIRLSLSLTPPLLTWAAITLGSGCAAHKDQDSPMKRSEGFDSESRHEP